MCFAVTHSIFVLAVEYGVIGSYSPAILICKRRGGGGGGGLAIN